MKKKILIVKSDAIGDVLMTTPLIREIAKKEPSAEIDFLIEKWSAPICCDNFICMEDISVAQVKNKILQMTADIFRGTH